jgi:hypothetical protein
MRRSIVNLFLFLSFFSVQIATSKTNEPLSFQAKGNIQWITASRLMPSWGFYPNGSGYGGTFPLDKHAAWTANSYEEHTLTWLAEISQDGDYDVWLRYYGGYGKYDVLIDEKNLDKKHKLPGRSSYIWGRIGSSYISKGLHYIDITVSHGILDAILLSSSENFNPSEDLLPKEQDRLEPLVFRSYRDNTDLKTAASKKKYVTAQAIPFQYYLYDFLPSKEDILQELKIFSSKNEYAVGTFLVHAFEHVNGLSVEISGLVKDNDKSITAEEIDVRVVHVRRREIGLFGAKRQALVPELLLKDDRNGFPPKGKQGGFRSNKCITNIAAGQTKQIWLEVLVNDDTAEGLYQGKISFKTDGLENEMSSLSLILEVLPISLNDIDGYYSLFHPVQPNRTERKNYVYPSRYLAELKDQVQHGLNFTTIYGKRENIQLAKLAGMNQNPCIMTWPDASAKQWIVKAQELGYSDLLFYCVDEPTSADDMVRLTNELNRRKRLGFKTLNAINNKKAQQATKDLIEYPVYNIYIFNLPDNHAVTYALKKGFKPISYWTTSTPFPLYYRALVGLYNSACGYVGCIPWSYQDMPENRLYDPDKSPNKMTYPDEFGYPIPTICYKALRAGLDDVRYLQSLDRSISNAEEELDKKYLPELKQALEYAQKIREKHFESIRTPWFEYLCDLRAGDLQGIRDDFRHSILLIEKAMNSYEN